MKKHILILSTVLFCINAFAQVPNYVSTNGLVGYWPFNGNANDESGNGNNGTVNGATLTADRFGVANKAYSFDGLNDLITISAQSTINPQSDYSVSLWFNSPVSDFNGAFLSMGTWFCKLGHDNPGLFYKDEIGNQANNWYEQAHFLYQPSINNWHNLIILKSNNNVDLYIDTIFVGNMTTYGFSNFNPSSLIQFGYYCCQEYFLGSLDDIGIWNRKINLNEIHTLFESCQLNVTTQPSSQNVATSVATCQMSVNTSATVQNYQWQTDLGVGFQNLSNAGQYSGVLTNTLNISGIGMTNNNQQFRCIINDGSCIDTSEIAVLTVINDLGLNELENTILIAPNPATDQLTISCSSSLNENYILFDPQGRSVLSGKLSGTTTQLDLSKLARGNYLLQIGDKKTPVKLVKE
jgi:hypothetical protein